MPKIKCPYCLTALGASDSFIGRKVTCPSCKRSFMLNAPRQPPPPVDSPVPQTPVVETPQSPAAIDPKIDPDLAAFSGEFDPATFPSKALEVPPPTIAEQTRVENQTNAVAITSTRDCSGDGNFASGRTATRHKSRPQIRPCRDCGEDISRRATTCPHCGAPQRWGVGLFLMQFMLGVPMVFCAVFAVFTGNLMAIFVALLLAIVVMGATIEYRL